MSYPRIVDVKKKRNKKLTEAQAKKVVGEKLTVEGEAITLKTVIEQMAKGFPVPMQRQEIKIADDINQMLQGKRWDVPSDIQFKGMSKVERQRVINNLGAVKQGLTEKLNQAIAEKQALDAKQTAQETAPPPAPPAT